MLKFDRAAIMARAWLIFREAYSYPSIKFASIGWKCFGSCVRRAWAEAREAARVAAIPAQEMAARITVLQDAICFASFGEGSNLVSSLLYKFEAENKPRGAVASFAMIVQEG